MNVKFALVVVLGFCIGGCVEVGHRLAKKPMEEKFDTAASLTLALKKHYSGVVDGAFTSSSAPADKSGEFRFVGRFWCEPLAKSSSIGNTKLAYGDLCSRMGGAFDGDFCVKPNIPGEVLFMAQIRTERECTNGTVVRVVEPTGSLTAPAYVTKLKQYGYLAPAEVAAKGRQTQERQALEEDMLAAMLPLMRKVGARICQTQGTYTYVGYVENMTDEKLQIRIATAFITKLPQMKLDGFQQQIVWDRPDGWRLCE